MVEVFELRAKVREVLEAVTERVGELGKKKELLINKVNFLRNRLASSVMDMRKRTKRSGVKLKKKSIESTVRYLKRLKKTGSSGIMKTQKRKNRVLKSVDGVGKIFHPISHG